MVLVRFPFRGIMVVVEWFARRVRWVGGLNAVMTSSSSSVSDSELEGTYSASEDMVARCLRGEFVYGDFMGILFSIKDLGQARTRKCLCKYI